MVMYDNAAEMKKMKLNQGQNRFARYTSTENGLYITLLGN